MKNKIKNENKKRKMNRDYCGVGVRSIQRIAKPLIVSMMIKFSISTEFHGLYSVSYEHFAIWDCQNNDLCVCRAVLETVSSNAPLMNNFPCFALCENNFIEDIFCIICSSWVSGVLGFVIGDTTVRTGRAAAAAAPSANSHGSSTTTTDGVGDAMSINTASRANISAVWVDGRMVAGA